MGEWSEYFEDFPEENPANYDKSGRYNPGHRAAEQRLKAASEKVVQQPPRPDSLKIANDKLDQILRSRGPAKPSAKKQPE